jgi:4-hydroxy-tetrahydrodipicolinate reductase
MVSKCNEKRAFSSSNFSLGVNIFFEMNEYLAKMMAKTRQL